ncbi:MAG TPA: hypothetical protein VFY49_11645 [Myxococcota bacterium]|nr:hypothetical protein [Myxococcota bacterium]
MSRRASVACTIAVWLLAVAAAAEEPKAPPAPSPQLIARGTFVMRSLESGDFSTILDQMHHPTGNDEGENIDDRRAISVAFQFLSTRFGALEGYELAQGPVDCMCVSLAMGTEEYWAKDAETDHGAAVAFTTRHAKISAGIVRITQTNRGQGWMRSIEFGVPATAPGAKDQMTRIAREMFSRMQAVTRKPKGTNTPAPKPE